MTRGHAVETLPANEIGVIMQARGECYQRSHLLSNSGGVAQFFAHAHASVPFYSALPLKHGNAGITDFPVISKADVARCPGAFHSGVARRALFSKSSGTDGPPLRVSHDLASWYEDAYFSWRHVAQDPIASSIADGEVLLLTDKHNVQECVTFLPEFQMRKFRILNSFALDSNATDLSGVVVLHCRPSLAIRCFSSLSRAGLRPQLLLCGGENLHQDQRSCIKSQLGCEVRDMYAVTECGLVAMECCKGSMHLLPNRIVEVSSRRELSSTGRGHLVITNLFNWAMPFIRYASGDMALISLRSCACGATGPVISELAGRECICSKREVFDQLSSYFSRVGVFDYSITLTHDLIDVTYSSETLCDGEVHAIASRAVARQLHVVLNRVEASFWAAKKMIRFKCEACEAEKER